MFKVIWSQHYKLQQPSLLIPQKGCDASKNWDLSWFPATSESVDDITLNQTYSFSEVLYANWQRRHSKKNVCNKFKDMKVKQVVCIGLRWSLSQADPSRKVKLAQHREIFVSMYLFGGGHLNTDNSHYICYFSTLRSYIFLRKKESKIQSELH